ncbi:hypothetical protein [Streptomyces phage phiScoe23]|nr:hypothetical protein [Streptomyces phage phiScoe23]
MSETNENIETTDEKPTPKRRPRKAPARQPEPAHTVLTEAIERQVKELTEVPVTFTPTHRTAHHLNRSAAWQKQFRAEGAADSQILTAAFEAAGKGSREALEKLAAVALSQIERLDGGK